MARTRPIRITENDRREFARLVRNSKAKIRRTARNYGIDLSAEVIIPDSIERFQYRSDFNRWKQQMESFTNRYNLRYQFVKNEHGVVISKADLNRIQRDERRARQNALRKRKELERNLSETYKRQRGMLKRPDLQGFSMPPEFDFSEIEHGWQLDYRSRQYSERADPRFYDERLETMKDNFIRSVEGTLGAIGEDRKDVIKKLRRLDPLDFYNLYQQEYDVMNFQFWDSEGQIYDSSEQVLERLEQIVSALEKHENGETNDDLKNF